VPITKLPSKRLVGAKERVIFFRRPSDIASLVLPRVLAIAASPSDCYDDKR
jgi:hypothetical protein